MEVPEAPVVVDDHIGLDLLVFRSVLHALDAGAVDAPDFAAEGADRRCLIFESYVLNHDVMALVEVDLNFALPQADPEVRVDLVAEEHAEALHHLAGRLAGAVVDLTLERAVGLGAGEAASQEHGLQGVGEGGADEAVLGDERAGHFALAGACQAGDADDHSCLPKTKWTMTGRMKLNLSICGGFR